MSNYFVKSILFWIYLQKYIKKLKKNKAMKYREEIYNYIPLIELKHRKEIGNRSYNALFQQGLYTVQDIIQHYNKYGTFKNIKNIGELSNIELTGVIEKYPFSEVNLPFALNEGQSKYFKSFMSFVYPLYRNTLSNPLNFSSFEYLGVVEALTEKEDEVRNSGNEKMIMDFYLLKHYVFNFVNSLSKVSDRWSFLLIYVQAGYDVLRYNYQKLNLDRIYNPFRLIYETLFDEKFFDSREKLIIKNCFYFEEKKFKGDKYSSCLQELSKIVGLSSERVRQIRGEVFYKLLDFLKISDLFKEVISEKYEINYNTDIVFVKRDKAKQITESEGTDLSHIYYDLVLYSLVKDTHKLIGIVRYTLFQHNTYFRNTSFYSVKKEYAEVFDFNGLIRKVTMRYKSAVKRDEIYDIEKYTKPFFKHQVDAGVKEKIFELVKVILENDYNIKVEDGKIIFKRTSKETLQEVVYKVLKASGRPMNIEEIYEEVKKIREKISKDSIRSTVVTDKSRFVSFDRSSTYAVKDIVDNETIKPGTIRSIAQEYLEMFDKPVPVNDVIDYVHKYRPKASRSSIISNLKLDSSHIFIFYKDKTMGLSSKPYYNPADENALQTRWEKNFEELVKFISEHDRYPELNFDDKEEFLLYKFCRLNALLYSRNKLSKLLYDKMKSINFDFDISKWPYLKELKKSKKYETNS